MSGYVGACCCHYLSSMSTPHLFHRNNCNCISDKADGRIQTWGPPGSGTPTQMIPPDTHTIHTRHCHTRWVRLQIRELQEGSLRMHSATMAAWKLRRGHGGLGDHQYQTFGSVDGGGVLGISEGIQCPGFRRISHTNEDLVHHRRSYIREEEGTT